MTCSFFGHGDAPSDIRGTLKDVLTDLIENHGADLFYVGNHGNFDKLATSVLGELGVVYPHIKYYVVLAYLPTKQNSSPTVFPEGIENVPKRFAINFRNKWMIEQSELVVAYVNRSFGGAQQFVELARKKKKEIINIAKKGSE